MPSMTGDGSNIPTPSMDKKCNLYLEFAGKAKKGRQQR